MKVRLDVRKCAGSCKRYLKPENENEAACIYSDEIRVKPNDRCKYELLKEASARKLVSPEESLLSAIFGSDLEITLEEAKEIIEVANRKYANQA